MNVLFTTMAVPVSDEDIAVGRFVFQHFLHEEFEQDGVDEEILHEEDVQMAGDGPQINLQASNQIVGNNRSRQIGVYLRELAIDFDKSKQRQSVRHHADQVDLGTLTYDNFWNLLNEVFLHGVTGSNLIALFTFCSDVLKRCVRNSLRSVGLNLFRWALEYVVRQVIQWVVEHGGWEVVLKGAWNNKVVRYVAGAVLVGGLSYLVYRGIKN